MICSRTNKVSSVKMKKPFVRNNGWTWPLNILQVLAWIILTYIDIIYFSIIALYVEKRFWPLSYGVIGLFYAILHFFLFWATSVNPADDNSIQRHKDKEKPLPAFDRTVHDHVIENYYCHICEVEVGPLSKHCSACNKCVAVFDHHCKWLNNCVGEKNYRLFFVSMASALACAIATLCFALYSFIEIIRNFNALQPGLWWNSSQTSRMVVIVFIGITIGAIIIVVCMVGHLMGFHVMLKYRNITTYEYVVRQRQKAEEKEVKKVSAIQNVNDEIAAVCIDSQVIEAQQTDIRRKSSEKLSESPVKQQKGLLFTPVDNRTSQDKSDDVSF